MTEDAAVVESVKEDAKENAEENTEQSAKGARLQIAQSVASVKGSLLLWMVIDFDSTVI